jgi:amino acid adenylation domain-containing protein
MSEINSILTHGLTNIVEILQWRAVCQPDEKAFIFLCDGEEESAHLTHKELDAKARVIATLLQSYTLGERVLLIYPTGLEFIAAFMGCLYAGAIAVPVYPPRHNQSMARLQAIMEDAQATVALTTLDVLSIVKQQFIQIPILQTLQWIATDYCNNQLIHSWRNPVFESDTLAFLQYTSGSTGKPKGVMVSHGNIMHNQSVIQFCRQPTNRSIGLSWLPLFHDLGLIGFVLHPLYSGITSILMPPASFFQKPFRWLQAISRYKATISAGPNFAYDLCSQKITSEQMALLDLSSWEVAFNGAEPIHAETIERFSETFRACGFRREAILPCYGMAETTLIVSGGPKKAPPVMRAFDAVALKNNRIVSESQKHNKTQIYVSSGLPYKDFQVIIVNPDTLSRCRLDQVGEIWIAGPSITKGYWKQIEETERSFHAYLSDSGDGPFFRTGDLGFIQDGELFVTGRIKDTIIIRGQNHFPSDIEWSVGKCHEALLQGSCAAFSIDIGGKEHLVITQEVKRSYLRTLDSKEVFLAIRQIVLENHGLEVHSALLLRPGSIPKTSSGKIQHYVCRARYLEGSLNIVADWSVSPFEEERQHEQEYVAPRSISEEILSNILTSVLGLERIGINDNFFELGLHSLLATQLISRLRDTFEVEISLRAIFEAPTIAQIDQIISRLRTLERESIPLKIEQIDRSVNLPLSFAQERLWFLHQLEGASTTYNMPAALRLTGTLNLDAFHQSLAEIVRRHEVLRTGFHIVNGTAVQVIHPDVSLHLERMDLQHLQESEREIVLKQQVQELAISPFNLERAPLIRYCIWQLSDNEHVFGINMHHIISDGWSISVLVQELSALYPAYCAGQQSPLPELEFQYADFALWQRQWLSGEVLATQINYWRTTLQDAPEFLQLPTDRIHPSIQTYSGSTQRFILSSDLTQQLKALSWKSGTTLFMTLLAAFSILLYRYSGQSDIIIGSPIANRHRREIESLIGFFVNTLALRIRLEDNPSFEELLQQIRETTIKAYEHQDVPFAKVVETLQPQRSISHTPLFQVMFDLQNTPIVELKLPGVTFSELNPENTIAKFDLILSMSEVPLGLNCEWKYNTDLFDGSTIERMASHFESLLSAIVENPQQGVSEVPFLSGAERHQLLVEWNDTEQDYPQDKSVHELFEEQVEKTPEAIAIVFEEQRLTYGQLNLHANQLAHHLQSLGVKPEVFVGICVERSLEMLVGLLGILKAGGTYVPLDPSYPEERLASLMSDAPISVLLTKEKWVNRLPENKTRVVCIDLDWRVIAQESDANPVSGVKSSNLAYVIYTSGSTGHPKGVMIEHNSVINLAQGLQQTVYGTYEAGQLRVSMNGPLTFDTSVKQIIQLLQGHILEIIPEALRSDGAALLAYLQNRHVDVFDCTPSQLGLLISAGLLDSPTAPRYVLVGGEPIHQSTWQQLATAKNIHFYNLYGPTECTVDATVFDLRASTVNPVIGRPSANTQIYILSAEGQPTPIGVPGELHIGGTGLARGYLNRPDLTAEKFIPHLFSHEPGARLYKTGDLARYLPDGNIEFLGRIDHQVKIRGFRIELGEIEAVLSIHPRVQQSMVIATEDPTGNKRLVAYVVVIEEEKLSTQQLREFLQQQLPAYMVPSTFVILDTLPLTPNGKVDRKALTQPDLSSMSSTDFVSPRTHTEEVLAEIWEKVLKLEKISVHDNFFDLGGHSLLATQVSSRISEAFQVKLPLKYLFEASTLASLAAKIDNISSTLQAFQNHTSTTTIDLEEGIL